MSINRSHWRNVSFCDATNPDQALGGFIQNGSVTEADFLDMLGILLVTDGSPPPVQERITSQALGGLAQNGSITEANFLDMLGILLVTDGSPPPVQERITSRIVSRMDQPLEIGVYDIYCDASLLVNNELLICRGLSHNG
ncbi:hypothetical protein HOY82DRAFT_613544 [Tuber indicum]|nr:hypothetical protein HOY82DRAFT_613544 [Tuber indicum]